MKLYPKTRGLVRNALIAALYAALSLALAPMTFGLVQCRVSEALTLLPVLNPAAAWGVTLGCAVTNLVGAYTGANFLGPLDVLLGSATTLAACLLTARLGRYRWHGLPLLASLPPVVLNGLVIGWEWGFVTGADWRVTLGYMALVGLGQLVSCTLLGCLLIKYMERTGADKILAPAK